MFAKIIRKIKNLPYNFIHTISSTYINLRFPFLRIRDWEGREYNSYWFENKICKLRKEGGKKEFIKTDDGYCTMDIIYSKRKLRFAEILNWVYSHPIQWIHPFSSYSYFYCIPNGWRKAFGIQICKEIKQSLKRHHIKLNNYSISQIKEKYGELRWYDNGAPAEVEKIIEKYAYISRHTCINCGRLATVQSTGWICPYCDDCSKTIKYENLIDFGIKSLPWYGWTGNINRRDDWKERVKQYEES